MGKTVAAIMTGCSKPQNLPLTSCTRKSPVNGINRTTLSTPFMTADTFISIQYGSLTLILMFFGSIRRIAIFEFPLASLASVPYHC